MTDAELSASPRRASDLLTIGEVARRVGLAPSAIRYYESCGLITAVRSAGGQRRFLRAEIRRISFILIAQKLGLSLDEISAELARLPSGKTPGRADWADISARLDRKLAAEMQRIAAMRENLSGCIGCGCLSLDKCALYNPEDGAARLGSGPRYAMGDRAVTC